MTGFYARYDALMYRVMYPRNGIKLNNYVRPGSIMRCPPGGTFVPPGGQNVDGHISKVTGSIRLKKKYVFYHM